MITTNQVNVNLDKGPVKLKRTTTKDVDASIKVKHPKKPIKAQSISIQNIVDVGLIIEKKRRDEIMEEKKLAMKERMAKAREAKKEKKK